MNVIIIEDEKPAARRLNRLLAELDVEVSTMLHSVEEALDWFQNNPQPDLIFLDIQLSDGLSFEIFDMVRCKVLSFSPPLMTNMLCKHSS